MKNAMSHWFPYCCNVNTVNLLTTSYNRYLWVTMHATAAPTLSAHSLTVRMAVLGYSFNSSLITEVCNQSGCAQWSDWIGKLWFDKLFPQAVPLRQFCIYDLEIRLYSYSAILCSKPKGACRRDSDICELA